MEAERPKSGCYDLALSATFHKNLIHFYIGQPASKPGVLVDLYPDSDRRIEYITYTPTVIIDSDSPAIISG
ncbi:hypothetical protein D3C86_1371340 [compost metagenome]